MEKLLKVIVLGRVTAGGQLDAEHRETIAINVDPFDKMLRTFVLKTASERFEWLKNVPESQFRMYWIDEEGDQISIYIEDDMETCIALGGKIPKVFIDLNAGTKPNVLSHAFMSDLKRTLESANPLVANATETFVRGEPGAMPRAHPMETAASGEQRPASSPNEVSMDPKEGTTKPKVVNVFLSDLRRAMESANPLAEALFASGGMRRFALETAANPLVANATEAFVRGEPGAMPRAHPMVYETTASGEPRPTSSQNESNVLHANVICDGCDGEVRGFRYKCVQCRDFDLCQGCEAKGLHKQHVMYRMPEPLNELGSRFDRRLFKNLRKRMPREDVNPSCRRSRHHEAFAGAHTGFPTGVADPTEDPSQFGRDTQKIITASVDMISNVAQHFASMMDPFGVTLDAVDQQPQAPTSPQTTTGTTTPTGTAPNDAVAAAPNDAVAAAAAAAPSNTSAPTTVADAAAPITTDKPKSTIPAGTPRNPDLVYIEDDVDDFVAVPRSSSGASTDSSDSVVDALIDATKEASAKFSKRHDMDFD